MTFGFALSFPRQVARIAEVWTPANLGASLALWLDADDASTITLNGSNVSQWSDKSGNNNNATQATAANQPTYTANGFNGKPVLTFDGTDFMAVNIARDRAQYPNLSVIAAYQADVTATGRKALWGFDDGNWDRFQALRFDGLSVLDFGVSTGSSATRIEALNTNDSVVYAARFALNESNASSVHVNGVLEATFTEAFNVSGTTLGIGSIASDGKYPFNGTFYEFMIVDSSVSDDDRQKLEGYLAWKWGGV